MTPRKNVDYSRIEQPIRKRRVDLATIAKVAQAILEIQGREEHIHRDDGSKEEESQDSDYTNAGHRDLGSPLHGYTPPQYDVEPYGREVSLLPVTVRVRVELEPSSFCAVAHRYRPLVFGPERVTGRE